MIKSFLLEKFWIPVVNESVHYNPFNTTVYALIFGIAALYLVYPLSKKLDIDFDREFFLGIAPFILLGGTTRSLKDIDALNTFLLETPFIYILMFGFTLSAILLSQQIKQREILEFREAMWILGGIPLAVSLTFYSISNLQALAMFIIITMAWGLIGYLTLSLFSPKLLTASFALPVSAHFYDATTTVVALAFQAEEKHVVAQQFINIFGPYGMFLMKGLFIIPITWYIVEEFEGEERNYYLFLITLLGLSIGTRNILSVLTLT